MLFQKLLKRGKVQGWLFRISHLLYIYSYVCKLAMKSHDSTVLSSEMLDGCRALLSIATVTTPFVFDQLLKAIRLI